MPLPSIAVPPLNISSVACAATEVTPLKLTVPEAVTRPLMTAVLPLVAATVAPEPIVPPLNIKVLPPTTSTNELETIVAPRITLVVPPTVSISAPMPEVFRLPEMVLLSSSISAVLPEARMRPAPLLIVFAITTVALVPSASMILLLATVPLSVSCRCSPAPFRN